MRMTDAPVRVQAEYDAEAHVWVADSDDVPGLVAEHADFERLSDMVAELVPLLLSENGLVSGDFDPHRIPIDILAMGRTHRTGLMPA